MSRFLQTDSVSGHIAGEPGIGLGPGFNSNSCGSCHAQPAVGGSSPSTTSLPICWSQSADRRGHRLRRHELASHTSSLPMARCAKPVFRSPSLPSGSRHATLLTAVFTTSSPSPVALMRPSCSMAQPNFQQMQRDRQHHLPHTHSRLWRGPHRRYSRCDYPRQHGRQLSLKQPARHLRPSQLQRQRRLHHALRLESAEQIAARNFRRRSLQRRNWRHQRTLPKRARQPSVRPASTIQLQKTKPTTPTPATQIPSDIVDFSDFMRFLAPPAPS